MSKTALIAGVIGQDDSYLGEFLLNNGYKIFGLIHRSSTVNLERLVHLLDRIELLKGDLLDQNSLISDLVERVFSYSLKAASRRRRKSDLIH